MELVLNKQFTEMSHQEMMDVDGGLVTKTLIIIAGVVAGYAGSSVIDGVVITATGKTGGDHVAAAIRSALCEERAMARGRRVHEQWRAGRFGNR